MTQKTSDSDLHEQALLRIPAYFRKNLVVDVANRQKAMLEIAADPWQRECFEAMDPCLIWLAGHHNEPPPVRRFWWQRARGHSKTSDVAAQLLWLLYASKRGLNGVIGAEDKDQAKLVSDSMGRILADNEWLSDRIEHTKYEIRNRETNAQAVIVPADVASSFGYTPEFVVCDELTHWSQEKFWSSLVSSFGKKDGMLIVACNAGSGRDWKWQAREYARTSPDWHFSSPDGCVASWFTQKMLDEQRGLIPPTEYMRLWENKWQETGGEFVTLEEAKACCDPKLLPRDQGVPGWQYVAVVDYAEKKDFTVGCVLHIYDHRVIVDRMDVIVPKPGSHTKTSWVKNWMQHIQEEFRDVHFVIDEYQLLTIFEDLSDAGFDITRFQFKSGTGNYEIGMALRQAIIHGTVAWFPGCGLIPKEIATWSSDTNPDDLEHELASLIVTPTSNGQKWRFDHLRDDTHHDDRAFALGVGVHYCCKSNEEGYGYFGLQSPVQDGTFNLYGS